MRLRPVLALLAVLPFAGCAEAPTTPPSDASGLPPGAYASVRGAGVVEEGADRLQFAFTLQNHGVLGGVSCSGTIDGVKVKFQGPMRSVAVIGKQATFEGAGTVDGQPVNFKAVAVDGEQDQFSVKLEMTSARYDIQGPVATGRVDISAVPSP